MDRRSWLWRRKSAEKSCGETESSGSASSQLERYSDDQEGLRASSDNASPQHAESPEVSSHIGDGEVHETMNSLSDKLSAALLNINEKEELVKQHAKVAEEAVAGWEQAEAEVSNFKQQLDAAFRRNAALEDQISHLDGALKECVRQLRQSREEQEEKIHEALDKNTHQWESDRSEFENQLLELKRQLEAASSVDLNLQEKLHAVKKENIDLKVELLAHSNRLRSLALERDLINKAAETASKQHLESVKKIAKVEAECRRLRTLTRRTSSANDSRPTLNSAYVESLTDSQSDSADRTLAMDTDTGCSDSWASALIAELDQFKNQKTSSRRPASTSVEIDLMDDFLEMERLVALPEVDNGSSTVELEAAGDGDLHNLQLKVQKMESENGELVKALAETQGRFETTCNQLVVAEDELAELKRQRKELESQLVSTAMEVRELLEKVSRLEREVEAERALKAEYRLRLEAVESARKAIERQLETANSEGVELCSKVELLQAKAEEERMISEEYTTVARLEREVEAERDLKAEYKLKLEAVESARKAIEHQLETANSEVAELRGKVGLLQAKAEKERMISEEYIAKYRKLEARILRDDREARLKIKQEKELTMAAGKLADCQKTIASLGQQLKSLTDLDDLMLDDADGVHDIGEEPPPSMKFAHNLHGLHQFPMITSISPALADFSCLFSENCGNGHTEKWEEFKNADNG